jgi:hypothetical protein
VRWADAIGRNRLTLKAIDLRTGRTVARTEGEWVSCLTIAPDGAILVGAYAGSLACFRLAPR